VGNVGVTMSLGHVWAMWLGIGILHLLSRAENVKCKRL